jgi:outer membrane protein TolC
MVKRNYIKNFAFSSLVLLSTVDIFAETIKLDQVTVAKRSLELSAPAQEAWLTAQLAELGTYQAEGAFDSVLTLESGYENSLFQSQTNTALEKTKSYLTKVNLKKPIQTGTVLGLEYTRTSWDYTYSVSSASTSPRQQTQDIAGVTIEQNLWYNSFGSADRATIRAARAATNAARIGRYLDQQNVVLDAVRKYWQAYVAQENFRESIASRDRYEKLVDVVRRKNSLGYSAPGELSQVQAEYETRIQNVKKQSDAFLKVTEELITLLKYPEGSELEFVVSEQLPSLPALNEAAIDDLRALKKQEQALEQARNNLTATDSKSWPVFALVGKYYGSGLETNSTDSINSMWSSSYPKYYYGIKFIYSFGSGATNADVNNKKMAVQLEQSKWDRKKQETLDQLQDAKRKVTVSHLVAQSTARQKIYREKAAQELQKAYNQGRIDINQLITNLNAYFETQVAFSRAIGDYQIALQEWSAINDRLISDTQTNNQININKTEIKSESKPEEKKL